MIAGATNYVSNINNKPLGVSLEVYLSSGRVLSGQRIVPKLASDVINFKDSVVYWGRTGSVANIVSMDVSGTTILGIGASFNSNNPFYILDVKFVNTGGTLELYYCTDGASRTKGSTINRIISSDGVNWGSTSTIYGGSYISAFTMVGSSKLYFYEGLTYKDNSTTEIAIVNLYSLVNDGATWRKNQLSKTPVFSDQLSNSYGKMVGFGKDNELDEVFTRGIRGATVQAFESNATGEGSVEDIIYYQSDGYNLYKEEEFLKTEGAIQNVKTSYIRTLLLNSNFGVSSSYRAFGVHLKAYKESMDSYPLPSTDLGCFVSYSKNFGEWSLLSQGTTFEGIFPGLTTDQFLLTYNFGQGTTTASRWSFVSETGQTRYNIGPLVQNYSSEDNRRITLTLGNAL